MAGFDQRLIPPGINDGRTRALLDAFAFASSRFDFSKLLMRNSAEIPDDMLELAVHDFSLPEFIPSDGLPVETARRLVDRAWELHEKQGTDEGMHLGQSLLGTSLEITHWWQQQPEGPHNTQNITVWFDGLLLEGGTPADEKHQTIAAHMIDATKRWSQDHALTFGVRSIATGYLGAVPSFGGLYAGALPADDLPSHPLIEYAAATSLYGGIYTGGMEIN